MPLFSRNREQLCVARHFSSFNLLSSTTEPTLPLGYAKSLWPVQLAASFPTVFFMPSDIVFCGRPVLLFDVPGRHRACPVVFSQCVRHISIFCLKILYIMSLTFALSRLFALLSSSLFHKSIQIKHRNQLLFCLDWSIFFVFSIYNLLS